MSTICCCCPWGKSSESSGGHSDPGEKTALLNGKPITVTNIGSPQNVQNRMPAHVNRGDSPSPSKSVNQVAKEIFSSEPETQKSPSAPQYHKSEGQASSSTKTSLQQDVHNSCGSSQSKSPNHTESPDRVSDLSNQNNSQPIPHAITESFMSASNQTHSADDQPENPGKNEECRRSPEPGMPVSEMPKNSLEGCTPLGSAKNTDTSRRVGFKVVESEDSEAAKLEAIIESAERNALVQSPSPSHPPDQDKESPSIGRASTVASSAAPGSARGEKYKGKVVDGADDFDDMF